MSIADCSTIQPDLFGSPSKALLSQSSYSSSDTGDFIREATEKLSYYGEPYSMNIFTADDVPSEDEVSFSFASGSGSRHSLLDIRSPPPQDNEKETQVQSDSSSVSSGEQQETRKKTVPRIVRQRKVGSFGESVAIEVQYSDDSDELIQPLAINEDKTSQLLQVNSLLEPPPARDDCVTPVNVVQNDDVNSSSPEQLKRRERRQAVATCPPNPIDIQLLSDGLPHERRLSEELEETVATPRQKEVYSSEARLHNPLNLQLQLVDMTTCSEVDDVEESTPRRLEDDDEWKEEFCVPAINMPDLEFDDGTLDVCPNPPTSPRLHVTGNTQGAFFGGSHVDVTGSNLSADYSHQSQLDVIRVLDKSGCDLTGDVEEGVVGGDLSTSDAAIESLLAKFPHLSTYPPSSLLAISHFASASTSFSSRKTSDSAIITRKDCTTNTHPRHRQRSSSDSAAPQISFDDDKNSEAESWSHLYCDSGYHDEKSSRCHGSSSSAYVPSPRVSLYSSDLLSQEEGLDGGSSSHSHSKPHRRLTPCNNASATTTGGYGVALMKDDSVFTSTSYEESGQYHVTSSPSGAIAGTLVRPRDRSRRSQIKNYSQSSLGASSAGTGASSETISLTSLFETPSPITVEDLLSNLGFDDFNSPQLIPDRFIPKEIEHARPSLMRTMTVEEYLSHDSPNNSHHASYEPSIASTSYSAPLPYSHHPMSHSSQHLLTHTSSSVSLPGTYTFTGAVDINMEEAVPISHSYSIPSDSSVSDLPLGATAENFLAPRSGSPPPPAQSSQQPERETTRNLDARFPSANNLMTVGFHRGRLETVPEETASDLSPSPRWLSPRVSIDHSVNFDVAEGKLGASLNVQKVRKRSLPTQRDGYKVSVGSLVESDTGGDSIHFSVTSYDDEIAAEREKEREDTLPPLSLEDIAIHTQQQQRRRRRGVYTPPPALLTWLSQQQPIHEEDFTGDPDELPWPFNEQARLRKSLTEIQQAQMAELSGGSADGSPSSTENRESANESQFSGSSKAEGGSSISSSPPSSLPRSSPGPGDDENQDTLDDDMPPSMSRLSNFLLSPRRRHSRDISTSSLRASHKTRSLSCQSDYHILRKHFETLPSHVNCSSAAGSCNVGVVGEQEGGLFRNEMLEELRYTMSTSQRTLSRALALKGEQCRHLQEVANQT